jgi:magnesium chelatase family protein
MFTRSIYRRISNEKVTKKMLAVVESAAIFGVDAYGVRAEVNVSGTVPSFTIVGLPDAAVQESRERVRAAIRNSGLRFPYDKRIIVNLAPADIRKAGPAFDLPIAIGLLVATEQLAPEQLEETVFIGELGLDGAVRPVSGILPLAIWGDIAGPSAGDPERPRVLCTGARRPSEDPGASW